MLEPPFEADKTGKINRTRREDEKDFGFSPRIIRKVKMN